MSVDFTPTHRTNRAIGKIKAGSEIRVARYDDIGFFSDLLGQLGVRSDHITYTYFGEDVVYQDKYDERTVLPGDYVITDGEHFEVSDTDSGWELLPDNQQEGLSLSYWFGGLYIIRGDKGGMITTTAEHLHNLVSDIKESVPEPSPIKDARFIHAYLSAVTPGEYRTLAKVDGLWYDHNGEEYTEAQVLDNYDEIEVIR